MFDREIKQEFIDTHSAVSSMFLNHLFSCIKVFEERFDKDASEFSKNEIIEALKSFNSTSVESLRVKTSIIRQYTNFVKEKNKTNNANSYDEIDTFVLKQCVNKEIEGKKYISREDLLELLNELNNPCDQFLLLSIYDGIGSYGEWLEEVFFTKKTGIQENKILLNTGRELQVDRDVVNYAIKSSIQEEYENLIDNSNQKCRILLDTTCGYIINPRTNCKNTKDKVLAYNRGIRRFAKIKKYLGLDYMTIPRLQLSGFAYNIRKILNENNITFSEAFDRDDFKEISKRYGYYNMKKSRLYASIKDYLE